MRRALLCLAAFMPALTAGTLAAAPDPYQIYAHARAVWASQRYPQLLAYTVVVTVDEKGVRKVSHYRASYDAMHDRVYVSAVSEEEAASPHVPAGVNLSIDPKRRFQTLYSKRVGRTEEVVDFLGVPMLAPNYSFGIVPFIAPVAPSSHADQAAIVETIRAQFNDPIPKQKYEDLSKSEGPKEIGRVVSTQRDYAIAYAGSETVDGRETYHLSLRPNRPSDRLRLRELWIDAQTYATVALVTQGNFQNNTAPWVVKFAVVDGTTYIASETAEAPVSVGAHTYERAAITFAGIAAGERTLNLWNPVTPTKNVLAEPNALEGHHQ